MSDPATIPGFYFRVEVASLGLSRDTFGALAVKRRTIAATRDREAAVKLLHERDGATWGYLSLRPLPPRLDVPRQLVALP